jgi:phage recombination protein Bet
MTQLQLVKNDLAYWTPEKIDFLRKHYAPEATPQEFEHFVEVAKSRGLRPDAKQIYFIKLGGKASVVLSIDAYRLIAQRTGLYAGISPVQYLMDEASGKPISATITVKKIVHGHICEFSGTALYSEHNRPSKDPNKKTLWDTMPATMLEKCAEAKALRKAFPEELAGYYTRDEMEGSDDVKVVETSPIVQTDRPKVAEWIKGKLAEAGVPESDWDRIIHSLKGLTKPELLAAVKRIAESGAA